jgi:hypothetical protein
MGAVFEDCVFIGEIRDVHFRNRNPALPLFPKNRLLRCDFRKADLPGTMFFNLDIDPEAFPQNGNYVVLRRGRKDIVEWMSKLGIDDYFAGRLRDAAGTPAIVHRPTLLDIYSPEQVQALVDIATGA